VRRGARGGVDGRTANGSSLLGPLAGQPRPRRMPVERATTPGAPGPVRSIRAEEIFGVAADLAARLRSTATAAAARQGAMIPPPGPPEAVVPGGKRGKGSAGAMARARAWWRECRASAMAPRADLVRTWGAWWGWWGHPGSSRAPRTGRVWVARRGGPGTGVPRSPRGGVVAGAALVRCWGARRLPAWAVAHRIGHHPCGDARPARPPSVVEVRRRPPGLGERRSPPPRPLSRRSGGSHREAARTQLLGPRPPLRRG
jgi:hypothetical protein